MLAVLIPIGGPRGISLHLSSLLSDKLHCQVYTWTTANQLFIKGCATSLVVGASTGKFGLWFDEDLNKGRSQECATFGNPSLTPSSDFSVNCIEVCTLPVLHIIIIIITVIIIFFIIIFNRCGPSSPPLEEAI